MRGARAIINHIVKGHGEECLIFLHGWGGNKESLSGIYSAFLNDYRIIAVDFYGFGETPEADSPLTLNDYIDSVVEIIEIYGLNKVYLIGHSFGGKVAMGLTLKRADLVNGLVLISASGMRPRRKVTYYIKVLKHKLNKKFGIGKPQEGSPDYKKLSAVGKKTFVNIVNTHLDKKISKINARVLAIWGAKDKETPLYMARRIEKKIKKSRLVIFRNAGHFCYLERTEITVNEIKEFLNGF
ncbi:MAG: alpha/beta hydrolase [Firmicutes bacterium]|nr:alpha/beta hydrolase [Bacillota bacterium]